MYSFMCFSKAMDLFQRLSNYTILNCLQITSHKSFYISRCGRCKVVMLNMLMIDQKTWWKNIKSPCHGTHDFEPQHANLHILKKTLPSLLGSSVVSSTSPLQADCCTWSWMTQTLRKQQVKECSSVEDRLQALRKQILKWETKKLLNWHMGLQWD